MLNPKTLLSIAVATTAGFAVAAEQKSILPVPLSYQQRQATIASLLGWQNTPGANLCSGHYQQPKRLDGTIAPSTLEQKTTITSRGPNFLKLSGVSILKNNIIVKQPGREVHAELAHIHRNKAGEITRIKLTGKVHLYENGKHLVTDKLTIQLPSQKIRARTVIYHVASNQMRLNHSTLQAWGRAKTVRQDQPGITYYENATYSTCRPDHPTWTIEAKKLKLDQNEGIGTVHTGILRFKGVPIFPMPYFQFPIDRRRRTGLLTPTYTYETGSGELARGNINNFILTIPYYINLAPNYDDLLKFNWWSKRGFVFDNQFRYLNSFMTSNFKVYWAPNDNLADAERTSGISKVNSYTFLRSTVRNNYLRGLNDLHKNRWRVSWKNRFNISERWKGDLNVNAVSDDYYFRDYSDMYGGQYNLLRSDLHFAYIGNHWQDSLLVESYQTLHRYDQLDYNVQSPFSRQPEITLNGFYGNWLHSPLDLSLTGQVDNFIYQDSFNTTQPEAAREHIRAQLAYPIYVRGGSITPSVYGDFRGYQLTKNYTSYQRNKSYEIPIADLHTQWTWATPFQLVNRGVRNEFQIQAYYLYVPNVDQSSTPNFDSYTMPYNYEQLFSVNRYSGYDRLSNANQVSLGLHDAIIDATTGAELASFNVGIANAFDTPQVCLTPSCTLPDTHLSPLVTELNVGLVNNWKLTGSAAWNLETDKTLNHAINNVTGGLQYSNGRQGIFSLTYTYAPEVLNTVPQTFWLSSGVSNNIAVRAELPLSDRFRLLGYYAYDFVYERSNLGFVGIEYNACCWRVKLVYRRLWDSATYNSAGNVAANKYQQRILFTFEFKGLGDAGIVGDKGAMKDVLKNIPGYQAG
jgi:LPS-assembly protein